METEAADKPEIAPCTVDARADIEERIKLLRVALEKGDLAEAAKHSSAALDLEKAVLEEGAALATSVQGPNQELAKMAAECEQRVAAAQGEAAENLLHAIDIAAAAAVAASSSVARAGCSNGGGETTAVLAESLRHAAFSMRVERKPTATNKPVHVVEGPCNVVESSLLCYA